MEKDKGQRARSGERRGTPGAQGHRAEEPHKAPGREQRAGRRGGDPGPPTGKPRLGRRGRGGRPRERGDAWRGMVRRGRGAAWRRAMGGARRKGSPARRGEAGRLGSLKSYFPHRDDLHLVRLLR